MTGPVFMLLIGALYVCASIGYARERNWPLVIVSVCWGIGNLALAWASRK